MGFRSGNLAGADIKARTKEKTSQSQEEPGTCFSSASFLRPYLFLKEVSKRMGMAGLVDSITLPHGTAKSGTESEGSGNMGSGQTGAESTAELVCAYQVTGTPLALSLSALERNSSCATYWKPIGSTSSLSLQLSIWILEDKMKVKIPSYLFASSYENCK